MAGTMERNANLWNICLSHTLGCAIEGMKSKASIFGIDKTEFDQPGKFVKEARKHRKIPKSAPKGNFRKFFRKKKHF
jgi:hypothetical protein